MRGVAFFSPW